MQFPSAQQSSTLILHSLVFGELMFFCPRDECNSDNDNDSKHEDNGDDDDDDDDDDNNNNSDNSNDADNMKNVE